MWYIWPQLEGVYSEKVSRIPSTNELQCADHMSSPKYIEIWETIEKSERAQGDKVTGGDSIHDTLPPGVKLEPAQQFWPDRFNMEYSPQRWMFCASYLAAHPTLPVAPFDEPTSSKAVKASDFYQNNRGATKEKVQSRCRRERLYMRCAIWRLYSLLRRDHRATGSRLQPIPVPQIEPKTDRLSLPFSHHSHSPVQSTHRSLRAQLPRHDGPSMTSPGRPQCRESEGL